MVEVNHQSQRDVRVYLVESVQHGHEGVVEAVGMERELLGADPDDLRARLGQPCEPAGELGVGQNHRIAAREQDLAQFGSTRIRMLAAVGLNRRIVGPDVVGHLLELREALLLDAAVGPLDVLAGDQLLPVAEPAVGRACGDDVQQGHLVLVEQPFDRAVVELARRVLLALEVGGLVR